jgi:uncharacterized protein YjbI with pentapeptide repeats
MPGANFSKADLGGANLQMSDPAMAHFRSAVLDAVDAYGSSTTGAVFSGAVLRNAKLHGVDLNGADLSSADITGAVLLEVSLIGADLQMPTRAVPASWTAT